MKRVLALCVALAFLSCDWLQGPAGPQGAPGTDGTDGIDGKNGNTILSGSGVPYLALGEDGDYYIDTLNHKLYGPKSNLWGSWVLLIGPQGAQGDSGAAGQDGNNSTPLLIRAKTYTGYLIDGYTKSDTLRFNDGDSIISNTFVNYSSGKWGIFIQGGGWFNVWNDFVFCQVRPSTYSEWTEINGWAYSGLSVSIPDAGSSFSGGRYKITVISPVFN